LRSLGPTLALALLGAAITPNPAPCRSQEPPVAWLPSSMGMLQAELTARFGLGQRIRIQRGLAQTARFWRAGDGGADVFESFVRAQFTGTPAAQEALRERLEPVLAGLEAPSWAPGRGPGSPWAAASPVDPVLAAWAPRAGLAEQAFAAKPAFAILLNFPLTSLEEREQHGESWSAGQWAEAWLAEPFRRRAPAAAEAAGPRADAGAAEALAGQRIDLDRLVDSRHRRRFPPGSGALAAPALVAAIRAQYPGGPAGLARQRTLQRLLERIAAQTLPAAALEPGPDWDPAGPATDPPAEDTRYPGLLAAFRAARELDPYSPAAPTQLARSFREDRQLPELRVRGLLEAVCGSPLAARTGALLRRRLGRGLEPFDLWYDGFGCPPAGPGPAAADAARYRRERPALLARLGFSTEQAAWLTSEDRGEPPLPPARNLAGPGLRRALRADGRWLAEQLGRRGAEHPLLAGTPGPAFSEALGRVFAAWGPEAPGQPGPAPRAAALAALDRFWAAYRSAGPALLELDVWHWLYAHPDAGPADLKAAVLAQAGVLWNRYYAPVLGQPDCPLLASGDRLIAGRLSGSDAPLSQLIAAQLQPRIAQAGSPAEAFERLARLGRRTPDLWLAQAAGGPLGSEALLGAAAAALKLLP